MRDHGMIDGNIYALDKYLEEQERLERLRERFEEEENRELEDEEE
jgi:hypothetical protein